MDCIEATTGKTGDGYPMSDIRVAKNTVYMVAAHRLVFEQTWGITIPKGRVIMHTCDNPSCVNPLHLQMGTQADNMRDKDRKGRGALPYKGVTHCKYGHEFTEENTHFSGNGRRNCRACGRRRDAERKEKED